MYVLLVLSMSVIERRKIKENTTHFSLIHIHIRSNQPCLFAVERTPFSPGNLHSFCGSEGEGPTMHDAYLLLETTSHNIGILTSVHCLLPPQDARLPPSSYKVDYARGCTAVQRST